MTAGFVEQLRRLGEEATPGPWSWMATGEKDNSWSLGTACWPDESPVIGFIDDQENERYDYETDEGDQAIIIDHIADSGRDLGPLSDPAFIVAARNLWEPLVAVVEAAEQVRRVVFPPQQTQALIVEQHHLFEALAELGRAVEAAEKETGAA